MTTPILREYVRNDELCQVIEQWLARASEEANYHVLADKAGVSPRAISKILRQESEYQSVFLADRLMIAMGGCLAELDSVWLPVRSGAHSRKAALA